MFWLEVAAVAAELELLTAEHHCGLPERGRLRIECTVTVIPAWARAVDRQAGEGAGPDTQAAKARAESENGSATA